MTERVLTIHVPASVDFVVAVSEVVERFHPGAVVDANLGPDYVICAAALPDNTEGR